MDGWPKLTGGAVASSPALGDLDGDGRLEVVIGSYDGRVYAWHHNGSEVDGWPKLTGGAVASSPADLDGDGDVEVIAGSDYMYVWDETGNYTKIELGWPMFRNNLWRTGLYDLSYIPSRLALTINSDKTATLHWSKVLDVESYNIYLSDSCLPGAFNINSPNITGLTSTLWKDTSASTVPKRYYKVGAVVNSTLRLSNETACKFDFNIAMGWNAISLLLNRIYTSESLLEEIDAQGGSCNELNRWFSGGWSAHIHNIPVNNFDILAGEGYYVKCSNSSTWTQAALNFNNPVAVDLFVGWNALSVPYSTTSYTAESLILLTLLFLSAVARIYHIKRRPLLKPDDY
ncbi:MAG: hypothetical protein B6U72_07640 [Candidatus Altiarchaeales archaeon ex4484_2]|nr:MAG: hypothetical protein B6U72_07640 [Candidatus Altiarchaeales archaeon ex4484_2]